MKICFAGGQRLSSQQMLELQEAITNGKFCRQSVYNSLQLVDESGKRIISDEVVIRGNGKSFKTLLNMSFQDVSMLEGPISEEQLEFWDSYIKVPFNRIVDTGSYFLNHNFFDRSILDRLIPGEKVFFRTKTLDFAAIIDKEEIFGSGRYVKRGTPFYKALRHHKKEIFIISDVENELDVNEERYRAVILDGSIESIYKARYDDDRPIISDIDEKLVEEVKRTIMEVEENQSRMPSSYACEFVKTTDDKGQEKYSLSTFYHYGEVAHPVNSVSIGEVVEMSRIICPNSGSNSGANIFNRNADADSFSCIYACKLGFLVGDDYLTGIPTGDVKRKKKGSIWTRKLGQGLKK